MAKFELQLPTEIINDMKKVHDNYEEIFGGMTRAGAEVVLENVKKNVPASIKTSLIMDNIGLTRTYKTPSDDGINTKVTIDGYFYTKPNKHGRVQKVPAPLVANMFEYGSSKRGGKYEKPPKQPFLRKSFKKGPIEKAMYKAQKELSGGLLDE